MQTPRLFKLNTATWLAKTYWPNFQILSAATRVTCPPTALMEEQGALWWSILTRLNLGHMSSCFPFEPSLGRDSCLPDFFLPVQWLHPIQTKPKTWRNLFSAHTHIHWGISVQSTGCRVVHSWQGPAALFGVHSPTPTDNYWAQCPCNLRTWNYQGKIFKVKNKSKVFHHVGYNVAQCPGLGHKHSKRKGGWGMHVC